MKAFGIAINNLNKCFPMNFFGNAITKAMIYVIDKVIQVNSIVLSDIDILSAIPINTINTINILGGIAN